MCRNFSDCFTEENVCRGKQCEYWNWSKENFLGYKSVVKFRRRSQYLRASCLWVQNLITSRKTDGRQKGGEVTAINDNTDIFLSLFREKSFVITFDEYRKV